MKLPFHADFSGKVAVVTGGTGVLCSRMAEAIAMAGAKVCVIARNQEKIDAFVHDMEAKGLCVIGISADVINREAMEKAKETIHEKLGTIDYLINGAGGSNPKGKTSRDQLTLEDYQDKSLTTFFNMKEEDFDYTFDINFKATLIPSQVFAEDMVGKEGCSIINFSSMNVPRPGGSLPAYGTGKAATTSLTYFMAGYFGKVGIRVNALNPGYYLTDFSYKVYHDENGNLNAKGQKVINHTPFGRFGNPDELLGTVFYLLDSNLSGFVTGAVIPVDGGFSSSLGV